MRIVQVGLGPVGLSIAQLIANRPGMELAGVVDTRPDLAGRDLGEVLGPGASGLTVSPDAASLLERAHPDIVIHATGSFLADMADQLRTLLAGGASVISTCEELAYPFYRHPDLARDLHAVAATTGAVLLGTGVNPGFVMDKLPITLLGACRSARKVRVRRVVDASKRREPLQRKIGAGLTPAQFEEGRRAGRFGHIGLAESAHMVADAIGVSIRRTLREELRPVLAERPASTAYLQVNSGDVSGIDQLAVVAEDGLERVRLEITMAVDAESPADSISIEGSPSFEASIPGGLHGDEATASIVVNCAYLLRDLKPGLRTMLDVPLRGFELASVARA